MVSGIVLGGMALDRVRVSLVRRKRREERDIALLSWTMLASVAAPL